MVLIISIRLLLVVKNAKELKEALKGYLSGKFSGPELKSYDVTIIDTTIGNSSGFFLTGYTKDSLPSCKYPFCYLTMADNNFYWFYACQATSNITNETRQFFHSIQFFPENFKESEYVLPPTTIHKEAN
jgi:hypothetical protein